MNARFYLIIALLALLYGAWAYIAHMHGSSMQSRYDAITRLPVYAYVADTTKVAPIVAELKAIQSIQTVSHETGWQAATELITAYNLPLTENNIADYQFPDVITITLNPVAKAVTDKARILDVLRTHVQETDLDSQSGAFSEIVKELDKVKQRTIAFTIYAGILMLLIFIFTRLSYELHIYLKQKRKLVSVVDILRHNKLHSAHTWMMLILPVMLVSAIYYAGWYFGQWPDYAPWWSFASMGGSALIATLIVHFSLRVYEHDSAMQESEVVVVTEPKEEQDDTPIDS